MIYAKCIGEEWIAKTKDEFNKRQENGEHVYMAGMTTHSQTGGALYAVPLNLIYGCLRYGTWIAIVDEDEKDYPYSSDIMKNAIQSEKQYIHKIMPATTKETIDFVFEKVKNPELVLVSGYIEEPKYFTEEEKQYFYTKKNIH